MARTDIHLDSMLRHLGAAYYDSLHGKAKRSDVTRALTAVEEHLKARHRQRPGGAVAPVGVRRTRAEQSQVRHVPRVRDVMTESVVTVDRFTHYREIVSLITERRVSGVPVLTMGRRVAGVITEADLLAAQDARARQARMQAQARRGSRPRRRNLTAGGLMTAPAVTINPDATIPRAAREMTVHRVRRLPVVGEDGKLVGIVSRRDLLSVFLRPDADIAADVRELLDDLLPADPGSITATVRDGVVILTGSPHREDRKLIPAVNRLIWEVEGVIEVSSRLGERAGNEPDEAALLPAGPETGDAAPSGDVPG